MSDSSEHSRGYAHYVLGLCFLLTALNVMDRQVLSVVVEPVKREFSLSDTEMGLLTGSAFALSHTLAMIPFARLADLTSRRNVIVAGLFLWSSLTVLTGSARSYWHLFTTRVGVGAFETVGTGPAQALLSDYFPPERRGSAFSIHAAGGTVGAMAGFALGGALADTVGWRWTFVAFGLPGILLSLVFWRTVREPARSDEGASLNVAETLRYLVRLPTFRHTVLAASLNSFVNWGMLSWATAAMVRAHDLSMTEVGRQIAFSMTLPSALGLVAAGFITDRLGQRDPRWYLWWPACSSIAAVPFVVAFLLSPDPDVAFRWIIPGAFLNTMWVGTYNAVIQGIAKPQMRAMASAVHVLVSSALIGTGLGPVFIGALSDRLTVSHGTDALRFALAVAAFGHLWGAAHSLLAARTFLRDRSAASA